MRELEQARKAFGSSSGVSRAPCMIRGNGKKRLQPDGVRRKMESSLGTDFSRVHIVESPPVEALGMETAAGGGLSPMTASAAPAAGVAQMRKGGIYADGQGQRKKNKKNARQQSRLERDAAKKERSVSDRQMEIMLELREIKTRRQMGSSSQEDAARKRELGQELLTLKAEKEDASGGRLLQYSHLDWSKQDTPEKMRANYANIREGAEQFNPHFMTDEYLSKNYLTALSTSNMYNGLMKDLQGREGMFKDENGDSLPEMSATRKDLLENGEKDRDDIRNYGVFIRERFARIKKTGSSRGWDSEMLNGTKEKERYGKLEQSMARMTMSAVNRLTEKGGPKRWMKRK